MKEYIESGNSDINQNNKHINNKFNRRIINKIMNYLYLSLIIILIIIIIIFISIYFSKIKKYEIKKSEFDINNKNKNNNYNSNNNNSYYYNHNNYYNNENYYYNKNSTNNNGTNNNSTNNNSTNNNTNDIICDDEGFFLPEDDKTKCIECSIENCAKCFGSKSNHFCHKCNNGLNPIYEDNKIILCSICNEGYYLINGECKKYSFRARYKSDNSEILFINSYINDIAEINKMYIDGNEVDSPSIKHKFNDNKIHEVLMLVDITETDNSMYELFQGVDKMISIRFSPFFNTSLVYDMSYMFDGCSSLESIGLSNFDTSKVEDMDHMFFGCNSLKSIGLSNFDTSSVTNMDLMFNGCYSLTSISLSNFKTSNLVSMNSIFFNCSSLTSIDLSNFDTSKVYNMEFMFYFCSKLNYINILNFYSSKSEVELFNQNISSSGTIITNEKFNKTLDKSYIPGWKISIL